MDIRLLPLAEQVMVITGASSGIGLVIARQAAARGACVALAARNERDLQRAVQQIRDDGGRAISVVTDVADIGQVRRLADMTAAEFGRINTWVNNAAVSMVLLRPGAAALVALGLAAAVSSRLRRPASRRGVTFLLRRTP